MGDSVTSNGMYNSQVKYVQINLNKSKLASANLLSFIVENNIMIALIQEPWNNNKNKISGLHHKDFKIYNVTIEDAIPRSCIIVHKSINAFLLPNFSDADTTVVNIERGNTKITVVSTYMPHESTVPPIRIARMLTEITIKHGDGLIIGGDANSRHYAWGSTEINDRGEYLFDFINTSNLQICNRGNTHTFYFPSGENFEGWSNVIDITLSNNSKQFLVSDWQVRDIDSFSDHRYITFNSSFYTPTEKLFRNPKNTDWSKFLDVFTHQISDLNGVMVHNSVHEIENTLHQIESSFEQAFVKSCRISKSKKSSLPDYFSTELLNMRRKVRSQFNKSFKSKDWTEYKILSRLYKKQLEKSKKACWRNFCESINNTTEFARLRKTLAGSNSTPSFLQKEDGTWAESSEEMNDMLLAKHFPGSSPFNNVESTDESTYTPMDTNLVNFITIEKVLWAIDSFDNYKSPGPDGIVPIMLKCVSKIVAPYLKVIYQDCLRFNYIPQSWRKVNVVFIPKAGKVNHSSAKDFRPISLSPFLLKGIERILDQEIRSKFSGELISESQHAYIKGKSVDTALHEVVKEAEKAIYHKQFALIAFLDIEGAFNNVTTEAIESSLKTIGVREFIVAWLVNLLKSRVVTSNIGNSTLSISVSRGTPQGGVISPLLWLLVVNNILKIFNSKRIKIVAYADDVAIILPGLCSQTVCDQMSNALKVLKDWAVSCGLSINPSKTELVMFTKKQLPVNLRKPVLDGEIIDLSNKAKYLGVIIDSKLTWIENTKERVRKGLNAFYACRTAIGKSWGLSPKMIIWLYTAIIRPILTYGAVTWWHSLTAERSRTLNRVQRTVCIAATGALKTTSSESLFTICNLTPLEEFIKFSATITAVRLNALKAWTSKNYGHSSILWKTSINTHNNYDLRTPTISFEKRFKVKIPSRNEWQNPEVLNEFDVIIFTDGSKTEEGCGAGVFCNTYHFNLSLRLPNECSIFQCEVVAVSRACERINLMEFSEKRIAICVDSQAALKAIDSHCIKSKVVYDCLNQINTIGINNKITLIWVPGHSNIGGNESADLLARLGASKHVSWTCITPIPLCITKLKLRDEMNSNWKHNWNSSSSSSTTRILWPEINEKISSRLLTFKRTSIRRVIYAITGHWPIGKHGLRMGLPVPLTCAYCDKPACDITPYHFWCECPALANLRLKHLGERFYSTIAELKDKNLDSKFKFILNSTWFKVDAD